jgi:hypothetical protein
MNNYIIYYIYYKYCIKLHKEHLRKGINHCIVGLEIFNNN